jgi:hypothetical protein
LGPAVEQPQRLRASLQPAFDLEQQPALAQAGVGHHRDHPQRPLGARLLQRVRELRQLGFAPDHARLDAFDAAAGGAECARPGTLHEVGDDGLVEPLHFDRWLRLHVEEPTHMPIGVPADAQRSRWRRLLHARRNVDGNAADAAFGVHPAAEQHAAGVQADAHVEAAVAVLAFDLRPQAAAFGQQRQAGVRGALGVVFARCVGTEDSQQVVAGVLQDLATVRFDDAGAARERTVHHGVDVLGVEMLAEPGGADHVEEQDRDLFEALGRGLRDRSRRDQRGEFGAKRRDRCLDYRITEHAPLVFKALDDGFELLLFGRHGP